MINTALTLICNPAARGCLDEDVVDGAAANIERFTQGPVEQTRLSEGVAEDFAFQAHEDVIKQISLALRKLIGDRPIDIATQGIANRKKRLLIADMDSTMIEQECIDELAEFVGKRSEISQITERAMQGELDFDGALKARVEMLKGLRLENLSEAFEQCISMTPGGRALVQTMRKNGAFTALVSGGFTFFTERVANAIGFQAQQANQLIIEDGALTGAVGAPILGRAAKETALRRYAEEKAISLDQTIAVGDGANDLSMLGAAGLGVAFRAKPAVAAAADIAINHGDLTALLYLQGYRDEEFVT